jgi:hypothetical protein
MIYISKVLYCVEVVVGEKHHLLFASDDQINDVQSMRRWYIEETFNVAQLPFLQWYSIQCFKKINGKSKPIPLL